MSQVAAWFLKNVIRKKFVTLVE